MRGRKPDGPVPVGQVLDDVLRAAGVHEQVQRASAVDEWADKVGDAIAKVARPRMVSGSALVVEVRSSAWLNELNMMREEILRRLNRGRNEAPIEGLRFVLAEGPDAPRPDAGPNRGTQGS